MYRHYANFGGHSPAHIHQSPDIGMATGMKSVNHSIGNPMAKQTPQLNHLFYDTVQNFV